MYQKSFNYTTKKRAEALFFYKTLQLGQNLNWQASQVSRFDVCHWQVNFCISLNRIFQSSDSFANAFCRFADGYQSSNQSLCLFRDRCLLVQFDVAGKTQCVEVFLSREQFRMDSDTISGQRDSSLITSDQPFTCLLYTSPSPRD